MTTQPPTITEALDVLADALDARLEAPNMPPEPAVLNSRDAAAHLGISVQLLRRFINNGDIAVVDYGSSNHYISRAELDRFVADRETRRAS